MKPDLIVIFVIIQSDVVVTCWDTMKKLLLLHIVLAFCFFCAGCGHDGGEQPADYVGVFKSVRSSNDKTVLIMITKDDGVMYEATIDKLPIKGTWGQSESDSLGLITNQLNKGNDKYFLDFSFSIGGSGISGTAYRQ